MVRWMTIEFNNDLDLTEENIELLKKIVKVNYEVMNRNTKYLEKSIKSLEEDVRRFSTCSGRISNSILDHVIYLGEFSYWKKDEDVLRDARIAFDKMIEKIPELKNIAKMESYYEY